MEGVKLVVPLDYAAAKLMGSEPAVGARVCDGDSDVRQSDAVSGYTASKADECSSFAPSRGVSAASGLSSWTKKQDTELYRNNYLLSRCTTVEATQGMDHGMTNGSIALVSGSDGKQVQRKMGKVPRNGSSSFRKLRLVQADNVLPPVNNDDAKMELDMIGSNLVKCSNADKTQAVKQRNSINCRRGDRRNSKVPTKAKFDPFSSFAGLSSHSSGAGGSNSFGMYGLKPAVHDVTKLLDDISLDELLGGTYKCPTLGKDKGKKLANLNDNVLDTVRKVCSIFRIRGMQQGKHTEESDIHDHKNSPSPPSPSNIVVENGSDGDGSTAPGSSKSNMELEPEVPAAVSESSLYPPKDVLERLALPPPKDLESLWQEAVKPATMKLTDSRSSKQLSHGVSLPPFPWSHHFNGHNKSNNDALKVSNRSTCLGRWVRIRSTASFIGGGAEGFVDLDLLTYDDSLVPAGQLRYRLPEIGNPSSTSVSQHNKSSDASPAASVPSHDSGSTPHLKLDALHSPRVLAAARVLCDMASYCSKYNSGGILKWPKQPSQKAMKARKSRLKEIPEEEFSTPKSETVHEHVVRSAEYGSFAKRPKISLVEQREEISHLQAVVGLSSVSGPRSNRSSPSRLCRDSVAEPKHSNGSFVKSSFMAPPPPRALDRSSHNPQKLKKVTPMDWNRTRRLD